MNFAVTEEVIKGAILVLGAVICILFMKNGYKKGAFNELRSLLGVVVAVICIFLILILKSAVSEHTYGTAIVVVGAIAILSAGWKLTRMILGLLSGIKELPIIGFADRLLGAALGLVECIAIVWIVFKIYERVHV
jgi:hypothetical protein